MCNAFREKRKGKKKRDCSRKNYFPPPFLLVCYFCYFFDRAGDFPCHVRQQLFSVTHSGKEKKNLKSRILIKSLVYTCIISTVSVRNSAPVMSSFIRHDLIYNSNLKADAFGELENERLYKPLKPHDISHRVVLFCFFVI